MCGIFGIHGKNFNNDEYLNSVKSFLNRRGPDSFGIHKFFNDHLSFVHTRLSILDLSKYGDQPIFSHSKKTMLTFNGEIYNHNLLRKEIEIKKKINWLGTSDSETIVNFIEYFGIDYFLKKASGMFAFSFFDIENKTIILARDRFGEKPLYYSFIKESFIYSSILKPILKFPNANHSVNKNSLYNYFNYGFIAGTESIMNNVNKLNSGTYLTYNLKNQKISITKYWDLYKEYFYHKNSFQGNINDATNKLDIILSDAVKEQMISDVPIGCFLSGGIDSSLTSILMSKYSNKIIKTFNVSFENKNYDESSYAEHVASNIKSNHTSLRLDHNDLKKFIPEIGNYYDEPFADSSQIPTLFVSQLASKSVKVCLTGDGADELFGGYNRYFYANKICKHQLLFRNFISKSIKLLGPYNLEKLYNILIRVFPINSKINMLGDKLLKLSNILNSSNDNEVYIKLLKNSNLNEIFTVNNNNFDNNILNTMEELEKTTFEEKMMIIDSIFYLTDDILAKVDRGSMAFSLETRAPFLNKNVVNLAFSLPLKYKINNLNGKIILKKLINQNISNFNSKRPKSGFGIPLNQWLNGPLKEWAMDNLTKNNIINSEIFSPNIFMSKVNEHFTGKRNWQNLIWNFLMYQSWKDVN